MKKKDIMRLFKLSRGAWNTLCNLGKIKNKIGYDFEYDEVFLKSFDYEKYKKDRKETPEYKAMLSDRNAKVNKSRWSNASEEARQKHKEKCRLGALKSYKEHPEQIEKMKQGLQMHWANEENRKAQSIKMSKVYKNEEKRQHIKDGCKQYWANEENRKVQSERMLMYWQEHPEKIEQMKETNRQAQKLVWTEEKRKKQSLKLSAIWAKEGHNILEKATQTMKENCTSNSSKPAKESIGLLKNAGFTVVQEKPYPEKRWKCDAYIEELDCWIEFHYGLFHNHMPYDKNNPTHIKQAKYLYENFYGQKHKKGHHIYYTWTNLDVRKREYARNTGMTWFEFYTKGDFEQWLKILLN